MSLEKFMVVHFYSFQRLEIEGFPLKLSLILIVYIQVLGNLYNFIKIGHITYKKFSHNELSHFIRKYYLAKDLAIPSSLWPFISLLWESICFLISDFHS